IIYGEGGTMALISLAMGLGGASLVFCDAVITPAISVLSAIAWARGDYAVFTWPAVLPSLWPTSVSQAANWSPIGRRRMRLPVAVKIALHSAGAKGGRPGSPTPLDGTAVPFWTMWTSVRSE